MLVVGAKGFAKEVLEVLNQLNQTTNLVFYDDVNSDAPDFLYNQFPVLKTKEAAAHYFKTVDANFTIGIGNPILRGKLHTIFKDLGGQFVSTISPLAILGNYGTTINKGSNIMTGVVITNDVVIGNGVILNLLATIGHDCVIEDFVEICPSVNISGNCTIGAYSFIGTNATILPKVTIGTNVIIGAGSVVTKNIPDNSMAIGIPAKVIKSLTPLSF